MGAHRRDARAGQRVDLRARHGDGIPEEDVADGVRFLSDAGTVQDREHQRARDDVPQADDGLGRELAMPGAQRKQRRGNAGEHEREPDRLEENGQSAVRVRIDPGHGADVERGRDAHAADLRERRGNEHHPA